MGRALRSVTDMSKIGERTVYLDCDVLQADGGTRTAAITGSYVALAQAFISVGLTPSPLNDSVAGISVGIVAGHPFLDLDYAEDSTADVDMNVVMTGAGKLVEVQGTAEQGVFDRDELDMLLDLAADGISILSKGQSKALEEIATGS